MKGKITIGIIVVFIVSIFTANWYIAGIAEKKIDEKIRDLISQKQLPFLITYSDISVSPILAKASLNNIAVSDEHRTAKFSCDEIKVGLPYFDAIKLALEKELKDLHSLKIALSNSKFEDTRENGVIYLKNFVIKFDGHISKDMLEKKLESFPDEDQSFMVSLSGLKIDIPDVFRELSFTSDLKEKISKVDNASLSIHYNPDSNEIGVEKFIFSTPIISLSFSGLLKYRGNSARNFEPKTIFSDFSLEISPVGLRWGEPDETGRYSLNRVFLKSKSEYDIDSFKQMDYSLPKGTFNFLFEDLKAQFSGRLKRNLEKSDFGRISHINMDEISLDKLSISYKYENGRLSIFDTELSTPFLGAILNVEVDIDERYIEKSIINNAKLMIINLTQDMELALLKFERETGLSIPRDGKNIVLEASGSLGRPKIKGLESLRF